MRLRRARPLLGTLVEIRIDTELEPQEAQRAVREAFNSIAQVQTLMSYHEPASELSQINREAFYRPVTVSKPTWEVLKAAQEISEQSQGIFDVTIAPTLGRYGFLPVHAGYPTSGTEGGWRYIALYPGFQVRLLRKVSIDLGGIAKGYAVDRAVAVLQERGVASGCVNAGGDMRVFGGEPQPLHVRHPQCSTALIPTLKIDSAAATSAIYYSSHMLNGKQVTPLIDPRQDEPCISERSVTILARECMIADALTKVFYAEPEAGNALLNHYDAAALIMQSGDDGTVYQLFNTTGNNQFKDLRTSGLLPV